MANYKEEIAKILEQYVQQVLVDGRSSAETYAAEILRVLSSMELPALPLINPDEIADARLHPDLSELPSVMLPICECISLQETAAYTTVAKKQRKFILAIIQPILAALKAENEELKESLTAWQKGAESLTKSLANKTAQLSTARAEVKELETRIEKTRQHAFEHGWSVPYLAPDKEGGK